MLSVVIPFYNEEENVSPLLDELIPFLRSLKDPFEVICIDDGSVDNTLFELKKKKSEYPEIRILVHKKNYGQSAAYATGFMKAKGEIIITMDGDMQYFPQDIEVLLERIKDADAVCGIRRKRKDNVLRKIPSKIGNFLRNLLFKDNIKDMGCTYRAIKRDVLKDLPFFNGMHRFIPTLLKLQGYKVVECEVRHRKRIYGKSKYGIWNRMFVYLFDCIGILWWKKRALPKERIKEEI